jgi:hypothetical protein
MRFKFGCDRGKNAERLGCEKEEGKERIGGGEE